MTETLYVGLDLGSRNCEQLGMLSDGTVKIRNRFQTSEANLIKAFKELGKSVGKGLDKGVEWEIHVHMEAGELAPWVREVIKPYVKSVEISHSRDNAWIAKDPNKNDRIDAHKLADLLRMNRYRPVYYSDDRSRREFKQLVQHYDDLTAQQVELKQKIKSRLRTQGVIIHKRWVYTEKGFKKALEGVKSPEIRKSIEHLQKGLKYTLELREEARAMMKEAGKKFPEIKLFEEGVPGVGEIGAAHFSAYVQTPHRFSNKRKLWHYCRLGVCQRSSDGKKLSHPKLDRAGCGQLKAVARTAFNVSVLKSKKDNQFKRAYESALLVTHDQNHARLTVMRKIVSVLRAVWLTNTPYQDKLG
jgi:transposase